MQFEAHRSSPARPPAMPGRRGHLFAFGLALLLAGPAHATLFDVSWTDSNGPQWTGVVDTATDALTITSWIENPGGSTFFTLVDLATAWNAVTSAGAAFDVPDDWDMTIGTNWGFVRPVANDTGWSGTGATIHFAGWGGACLFSVCSLASAFYEDESALLAIPVDSQSSIAAYADTGGVVITQRVAASAPEPGTLAILALGLGAAGQARRRRRGC